MSDDPTKTAEIPVLSASDVVRGRWGRLAQRLGLVPVSKKGLLGRRFRMLVGERNGFLVAISSSHAVNSSSVEILVRYPLGHTVRGFAGDLKKRLRRRRRRHVHVGDGSVLQRLPYALFPPMLSTIERATDDLVAAMNELVRPLDRACESCKRASDLGMYVVNGVPSVYCESCVGGYLRGAEAIADESRSVEPDMAGGLTTGLAAAGALGVALGALASLAVIYGGSRAALLAAPVFAVLGFLTSAFASRGFVGSSVVATLAKLPLALVSVPIGSTFMTAVGRMTLEPAEWSLRFLLASFVGSFVGAPRDFALLTGAAAVGWLAESVAWKIGRWRPAARIKIERIERSGRTTFEDT